MFSSKERCARMGLASTALLGLFACGTEAALPVGEFPGVDAGQGVVPVADPLGGEQSGDPTGLVPTTGSGQMGGDAGSKAPATTGGDIEQPSGLGEAPSAEDAMWCDALEVMANRCHVCHGAELVGGAPMPLVTYSDMLAAASSDGRPVHELIGERIHDAARPMPPVSQEAMTPEEIATLDAWLQAGVPGSDDVDCGVDAEAGAAEPEEIVWPEGCEEFYEIRAQENGQPVRVPANAELNKDYTVPVPWTGEVYALALRPIANNKRVVHHWILYAGSFDFITSWSPGKEYETFDDGVGVFMPSGGDFRLNMHYYNVGNDQEELDDSGLEICVTRKKVEHVATTHMFSGPANAPAMSRVEQVGECTVQLAGSEPVHLITSSPHMHSYGVHAKLEILRQDGTVDVVDDGPFNWEDQSIKPVDYMLNDGDVVRTTCVYENNTNQNVSFGGSSEDEMCFNFARYYPKDGFSCSGGLGGIFGL